MTRFFALCHRRHAVRPQFFVGLVALMILVVLASPVMAQDTEPGAAAVKTDLSQAALSQTALPEAPSPDAIRDLLRQLQDPDQQAQLIEQLKTLLVLSEQSTPDTANPEPAEAAVAQEADQAIQADLQQLGDTIVQSASSAVSDLGGQLAALAEVFATLPELGVWFLNHVDMTDADQRAALIGFTLTLLAVVGAGVLVEFILRRLSRSVRERQMASTHSGLISKSLALTTALLLDLVLIAGFAAGGYAVLSLARPEDFTQIFALAVVNITVICRSIMAMVHVITAHNLPGARLLPITDETAGYLYVWGRRLTAVTVYGFYLSEIALVHGLPTGAYTAIIKLVGLLLAAMVVVIILQNQKAVEDWIRGFAYSFGRGEKIDDPQPELPGLGPDSQAAALAGADDVTSQNADAPADTDPDADAVGVSPAASTDWQASSRRYRGVRLLIRWFADLWHVLAIVYVAAIYITWALQIPGGFSRMASGTVQSVLLLAFGVVLMRVVTKLIQRGFAVPADLAARIPGLEQRANRYLPVIKTAAYAIIWGIVAMGILDAWGIQAAAWFASAGGLRVLGSVISVAVIAVIAVGLWELVTSMIERKLTGLEASTADLDRIARLRTLLPLVRTIFTVILVVIVALIVLSEIGVNIAPLLAGAGIIGVAVGFGSQKLVQDIITGMFILIEDQVSVGDVVDTGSHSGVVEAINLRTIRLRDLSGTVHIIPYSDVSSIKNFAKEFAYAVMDVGVAYREDVDEVIALLERCGAELQADPEHGPNILEPITIFGVDQFADSAVIIRCRLKTKAMAQWATRRAFNRVMKRMFDQHGIEIPFPHQTVYFGELKDGTAPPAYVVQAKGRPAADNTHMIEAVTDEEKEAALANLSNQPVEGDER